MQQRTSGTSMHYCATQNVFFGFFVENIQIINIKWHVSETQRYVHVYLRANFLISLTSTTQCNLCHESNLQTVKKHLITNKQMQITIHHLLL